MLDLMPVKIHLRFVFFYGWETWNTRSSFSLCVREERDRKSESKRESKSWIDWNPGKWMAEHRNNEPYLHFKAYSNKDNNGLGSRGKKELSIAIRKRQREWLRVRMRGRERECVEAKRTPGDCIQFVLWDRSMHIKRALNHTHEAWLMPPSLAHTALPPWGDKSNWFRLFALFLLLRCRLGALTRHY